MNALVEFVAGPPAWFLAVLLAPFVGSFLGVLIVRLPEQRRIVLARSACDRCGHTLGVRDLVPLVSYVVSGGRCRYCGEAIGGFPLMVELAAVLVAGWGGMSVAGNAVWPTCVLGWTLLAAGWIDVRTMILPNVLTLPLLAAGLAVTAVGTPELLLDHGLAAGLGYLVLFGVAWGYRMLRGRDGLGLGDAKLLAALGAWVGLGQLPIVLLMGCCLGLAAAGAGALAGQRLTAATAIPFGPFLALAGWLSWLYADMWNDWLMAVQLA